MGKGVVYVGSFTRVKEWTSNHFISFHFSEWNKNFGFN